MQDFVLADKFRCEQGKGVAGMVFGERLVVVSVLRVSEPRKAGEEVCVRQSIAWKIRGCGLACVGIDAAI